MDLAALKNLGKKNAGPDIDRCVQHYYRPASGQCSVCGSSLCSDCMRISTICKECTEHPLSPEEAARRRKARVARKPPQKKVKKAAPPKALKKPNKILAKLGIKRLERQTIMAIVLGVSAPLLAILLLLTALGKNPFGVPQVVIDSDQTAKVVKSAVSQAVNKIELYRVKNGKLPSNLGDIGIMETKSWKYQVITGDQYLVEVSMNGQSFSFNSNQNYQTVFPGMTLSQPKRSK